MAKKKTTHKSADKSDSAQTDPKQKAAATRKGATKKKSAARKNGKGATTKKKAATTRKVVAEQPAEENQPQLNVHTFVACDSISKEANTGKVTLHGLFDAVSSEGFPVLFQRVFTLFARMYGDGEFNLAVCLEPPGGTAQRLAEHKVVCRPGTAAVLQMRLGSVPLPRPGIYKLLLQHEGRTVGPYCLINATQREQPV